MRNRCGTDINFKIRFKGEGDPKEQKEIKNGKNRTLCRKDRFRLHKFDISRHQSGRDPKAKWEADYFVDKELVNKVRFTVTRKDEKAKDFKENKEEGGMGYS